MTKKNSTKLILWACASAVILALGAVFVSLPSTSQTVYAANTHVDVVFQNVYGLSNTNYIGAEYSGKIYLGGLSDSILGNNVSFTYSNTTGVGTTLESGSMDAQSLYYHRYFKVQSITNPYTSGGTTLDLNESYYDLHDSDNQTNIAGNTLMSMLNVNNKGHVSWYTNTATYTLTIYYTVSYAVDLNGATLLPNNGQVSSSVYSAISNGISNDTLTGVLKYDTYNQQWRVGGSADYLKQFMNLFQKTGYRFGGIYNADQNGSLVIDTNGTGYISRSTARCERLYMRWQANEYNIHLDPNGGTTNVTDIQVYYDSPYSALPTPTRLGYDFDGWWTAKKGGNRIENSTINQTADNQTLYAHWIPHTYNLTFDPGDGSCSVLSSVITCGQPYGKGTGLNGKLPIPEKVGYAFAGWWTEPDGEGQRISSGTIVGPIEADQTLYAHYVAGAQNVFLDPNGGTLPDGVDDILIAVFDAPYGDLPVPVIDDYRVFVGWYTAPEGGEKVTSETILKNPESHTLYAHWEESWFNHQATTLTQDANGHYIISSAEELAYLVFITQMQDVNAKQSPYYIQTQNIDLAQYYWPDISTSDDLVQIGLYGTYDGQGYAIENMRSGRYAYSTAIFNKVYGTIKNVSNLEVDLYGDVVAGIAMYASGVIENCTVSGNISAVTLAGGIVASALDNLEIKNCFNLANITASNTEKECVIGGILGESNCAVAAKISHSVNEGSIWKSAVAGGIVGFTNGEVKDCVNSGIVSGIKNVGGIVGQFDGTEISACYNFGELTSGGEEAILGGIAGSEEGGTISSCFNCVSIIDEYGSVIGGIVGQTQLNAIITNCFSLKEIESVEGTIAGGIVGKIVSGSVQITSSGAYASGTGSNGIIGSQDGNVDVDMTSVYSISSSATILCQYSDGDFDEKFSYDGNKRLYQGLPIPIGINHIADLLVKTNILDYLTELVTELGGTIVKI